MSTFIETKRFYGSSRLIRQQVANKLDVDPTGNVGPAGETENFRLDTLINLLLRR